jgi:predicted nucleic acid-binding protein
VIAIVDASPLYAAIDANDNSHSRCVAVLERVDLELIVPALVVAEVAYLTERRLGARVEAEFLRGLTGLEVEAPGAEDWEEIANLVERYGDFPIGATDASIVVLAERLDTDLIITLDRRHFLAMRMNNGGAFRLLPD